MTTERAIDYLERCADGFDPDFDEAVSLAVTALRAQQERENPEPLTLDELRQMDGEPVWVVWPDGRIKNKWWIVGNYDWNMMEFDDQYTRNNYGKTWLAYRHKPKEV